MVDNAPPSLDPANNDTMTGLFRQVLGKFLQNVDDMLPARVVAYDRDANRAQIQPLIAMVTTSGDQVTRAQIASVPVFRFGGGGMVLSFNLKPGDLGWIKANDRDISLFNQSGEEAPPNTKRKHSFEDAMFYPDVMRSYVINTEDKEHAVLQTIDGKQRIAIWPDRVKITSDNLIVLDSPLVECTGAIVTGTNPDYDDRAEFYGDVISRKDVIARGRGGDISLNNHVHDGVQTGGGNTGDPVV